ncbi:LytR/AlgR family response regulator transcription factor [Roseivirga sp. BDSF3-8]|uniref:LytR/AlgR family response regulator transcription factor n=1 Tax=Roseivirga sp. BDSF3-8 TaxID=3241598 RepID=UPI0035326AA4
MKNAGIFIVEDDYVVAKNLQLMLEKSGYNVLGTADSGEESLPAIEKEKPDLIILDIDLAGVLSGIEVGGIIRQKFQTPFIYLTAHGDSDTMSKALPTEPGAYLAKPFNEDTLRSSIELALYKARNPGPGELQPAEARLPREKTSYTINDAIFIKSQKRLQKVFLKDILFVEANDIYVNVYAGKSKYLVNYSMKAISEKFPSDTFLRVHRSYIVNKDKIEAMEYNTLFIDGHSIPVSKTHRDDLMKYFDVI